MLLNRRICHAPIRSSLPLSFDHRLRPPLLEPDQASGEAQSYPPYNIERVGENAYRLTVAAAGFSAGDLSIEVKENALTLRGEKKPVEGAPKSEFVYRGIAARAFERRFQLADFVQVTEGSSLENGLLHIDLVREVPEAKNLASFRSAAMRMTRRSRPRKPHNDRQAAQPTS